MEIFNSVAQAAEKIIQETKGNIILGVPLGLGKPNQLVNALFQRACDDISIKLEIYTALSLQKPKGKSELEARFLNPFADRLYGDYEDLLYIQAVRKNSLPENISVFEFFVQPGAELNNTYAQQHYMSSNYTHAARDLNNRKVNVLAQSLACEIRDGKKFYSMSCNPEVSLDLLPLINIRKQQGEKILVVGQVNENLPFIENHAECAADIFDILIEDKNCHRTLFSTPNMPVNMEEYFVGFNASALVKDNGTLQIGIGALGDALAYALLLREQSNDVYQKILHESEVSRNFSELIKINGGVTVFDKGLYGCSEMFTYGLLRLIEENVIRKTVKDKNGKDILCHAGFFLGPQAMYQSLRKMPKQKRQQIDLLNISYVNALFGDEQIKRQQRQHARFINTAFSVTLMGAAISDQLENGRVLSGVGGQYNFVAQAHELEGARSILLVRATRMSGGELSSNIVWSYGHTTIPRHLRDIIVSEYGIADLRSKSDAEVIKAMLNISDSRFQQELLDQAIVQGKVEKDYLIPEAYTHNHPERLGGVYQHFYREGFLPDFPLGSDFDAIELEILKALGWLKSHLKPSGFLQIARQLQINKQDEQDFAEHLQRMDLKASRTLKEQAYKQLLLAGLRASE